MTRPAERPGAPTSGATGERIEALLEASVGRRAGGPRAGRGAGPRWSSTSTAPGWSGCWRSSTTRAGWTTTLLDRLADDELVASLLLVHGLHPTTSTTRVERALDGVRPYLGSHGGDVELLGVDRRRASCGCGCWAAATAARRRRSR